MYKLCSPWAVYRVDTLNNMVLARFKRRSDACQYAKLVQANSTFKIQVIFDV